MSKWTLLFCKMHNKNIKDDNNKKSPQTTPRKFLSRNSTMSNKQTEGKPCDKNAFGDPTGSWKKLPGKRFPCSFVWIRKWTEIPRNLSNLNMKRYPTKQTPSHRKKTKLCRIWKNSGKFIKMYYLPLGTYTVMHCMYCIPSCDTQWHFSQ